MCKKLTTAILILSVLFIVSFTSCNEGTRSGTPQASRATPLPDDQLLPGAGLVKLVPADISAKKGEDFAVEVHVNTGSQKVAAYGFSFTFNPAVIDTNISKGTSSVEAMPEGYVQAVNPNKKGELVVAGFDVYGKGPNGDLALVKLNFKAVGAGTSPITLTVKSLFDDKSNPLGRLVAPQSATVTVK
jgi:hypothetical protein